MRFGERLAHERWVPWAGQYINFELLKRKIKECTRAADAHDLEEGKDEFEREFDAEIEKVLPYRGWGRLMPCLQAPRMPCCTCPASHHQHACSSCTCACSCHATGGNRACLPRMLAVGRCACSRALMRMHAHRC